MQINCENCNKQFNLDEKLIPLKGRHLQCGSCNHKWFFTKKIPQDEIVEEKPETFENKTIPVKINVKESKKEISEDKNLKKKFIQQKDKKDEKRINLLNLLLVCIVTLIAIILALDTFKSSIKVFFPSIEYLLNNLYESIKDIILFIKDLLK